MDDDRPICPDCGVSLCVTDAGWESDEPTLCDECRERG